MALPPLCGKGCPDRPGKLRAVAWAVAILRRGEDAICPRAEANIIFSPSGWGRRRVLEAGRLQKGSREQHEGLAPIGTGCRGPREPGGASAVPHLAQAVVGMGAGGPTARVGAACPHPDGCGCAAGRAGWSWQL